ncbi:MAG TPA: hypothetical protein VF476_07210 [Chitinophagaceae bacterium]
MKKTALFLLVICLVIIACQKKATPTVSTRSVDVSAPKPETTNIAPDTVTGKSLFMGRCNRCHGLPELSLYSAKRWDGILTSMIPKARLSQEQGIHLTAYVKNNVH